MTNKTINLSRQLVGNLAKALQVFTGHDSGPNLRHTYGNEWWEPIDAMREELRAALADPVPPACCTVTAEEQALLDSGEYRPEELFGIGGKPSCPKCHEVPVPPAGGEPEVRGYRYKREGFAAPQFSAGSHVAERFDKYPQALVDRAHVTRLQAENKELQRQLGERWKDIAAFKTGLEQKGEALDVAKGMLQQRVKQCADLQAELTKARELIVSLRTNASPALFSAGQLASVDMFLSNQSAPADKGQGEPVVKAANGFWQWLDSAYRDGSKGEEPHFTKYNMEVAYCAGANAEQPAPVAVVSRDICPNCQGSTYGCATCIPDFTPGNGNRARRRALKLYGFKVLEDPTLSPNEIKVVPAPTAEPTPTAYDGFDNGID